MVVEGGADFIRRGGPNHFHLAQHVIGPGGLRLSLAAADRVDVRQTRVDALDLGALGIEPHHGEQPMPDRFGGQRFDGGEDAWRLIGAAQRRGELGEIVEPQIAAHSGGRWITRGHAVAQAARPIRCGLSTA